MKIIYLLNCEKKNGFGHLTRSKLVADELKKQKFKVFFLLIRPNKFFVNSLKSFKTYFLHQSNQKIIAKKINKLSKSQNFDSLFIDTYNLKKSFFKDLSKKIYKFLLSDGYYSYKNLNIIFDQSLSLPNKNNIISNKKFVIVNKEAFKIKKKNNLSRKYKLAIFLGANCKISKIKNVFDAINKINDSRYEYNFFILGKYSKKIINLFNNKKKLKIKLFINLNSKIFLKELNKSQLAIGEGGNSALERYVMQIPSLNFLTNSNQKKILNLKLNNKIFYTNKKKYKNSYLYYFKEIILFLKNFKKLNKKLKYNIKYPDKFGAKRIALKVKSFTHLNHPHTKHS